MKQFVLDQDTWRKLFSLGERRLFQTGEVLYLQGADSGLYCISKGRIKNCIYTCNGSEKLLCLLEAPAITGETSVIDSGHNICSAVALSDGEAFIIEKNLARAFLPEHPDIMMLVLEMFAMKMRGMMFQAESTMLSIQQKLATMLLNFREYGIFYQGTAVGKLNILHEQLAGFLGTTRPKITRALSEFARSGLIKTGRGCIEILDAESLAILAAGGETAGYGREAR
jgi:CRP-like cAMP-binding protein